MARLSFSVTKAGVSIPADTLTNVLIYQTPIDTHVAVLGYGVGLHSQLGSDTPGLVQLFYPSTLSAPTIIAHKLDNSIVETIRGNCYHNQAVEPSIDLLFRTTTLHPQASMRKVSDRGCELILSNGQYRRLSLGLTFPQAQTADVFLEFEE